MLDSPDTPDGCWAHYSNIDGTGFRSLRVGAAVDLDWEHAAQDGYRFRATRVKQLET